MSFLDSIMIFHLVFSITRAATQQSRRVVGRHLPTSHERARGPGYPESAPPASRLKLTSAVSSSHAATLGRGGQDWTAGRMRKGRVSAPELQRKMGPSPILEPRHKPTGPPQPLQNPHSEFIRSIDRCACAHWCPTLCDPMDCSPPWNFPGKNTGVGLPYPTPGDLPDPGVELNTPSSPVPAGGFFTTAPPGKPICLQMGNGKSKQRWFSPNNTERMCQCICRAERPAAGPSPARGPPHTSNFSGHSEKGAE